MFIYCICTKYLVGVPFDLITASIRRDMEWSVCDTAEVVWKPKFLWQFLIFLLTIPHRFTMGSMSGEFDGQSSTPTPWSFNQLLCFWQCGRCQILLEKEISIFKKLVSRRKHEVLQHYLVNGCSDVGFQKTQWTNTSRWHCIPNHHRLWKLNTGLQATWAMSFSTLPPDSRTLSSKLNTKLALIWKDDFGPLGNSPVLLLLSPANTPLTTSVAKFLDTSVCGDSWYLDPSLSPFLVKFTQILESICLTILIRLRFSRLVVHLFLPHFFLQLNFLLTCLDTALCEQPASLAMNVCDLPSMWRVSLIVFWTTIRLAVFPMIVFLYFNIHLIFLIYFFIFKF